MGYFKGIVDVFVCVMFGVVCICFCLYYFFFIEFSVEVDLECFVCYGVLVGNFDCLCCICCFEGWIEWGGCGVVNLWVFIVCGIDMDVYFGFVFGMGIDCMVMFCNNVFDLCDFVEGDV